jgi:hypothetical protein
VFKTLRFSKRSGFQNAQVLNKTLRFSKRTGFEQNAQVLKRSGFNREKCGTLQYILRPVAGNKRAWVAGLHIPWPLISVFPQE